MTVKTNLESFIVNLFKKSEKINRQQITLAAGLSVENSAERRAIQRALAKLIQKNIIEVAGVARERAYILKSKANLTPITNQEPAFRETTLSQASHDLLDYLAKPIKARDIVAYQQHFLRSYIPNQTAYLPDEIRKELFAFGNVEPMIRPAGTYARELLSRLLIDLSWNSSRLEGNTYSILETQKLLELGKTAEGKNDIDAQMILNHKRAIEYMVDSADESTICAYKIYSIHALLSDNLLSNPKGSGRIRNMIVGVSGTTYLPLANPHLLQEYFSLIVEKLNLIQDPFEQSFFALVHISYLQAFEDVNKRTARLTANIPFIKNNLKPLSYIDVAEQDYVTALLGVYEKNDVSVLRDLYVWAYKRSAQHYSAVRQTIGEPNLIRLKYYVIIEEIIQKIILEKIAINKIPEKIKQSIAQLEISQVDATELQQLIESLVMSLHDYNIARFKIRPSEFEEWKKAQ